MVLRGIADVIRAPELPSNHFRLIFNHLLRSSGTSRVFRCAAFLLCSPRTLFIVAERYRNIDLVVDVYTAPPLILCF